MVSSMCNLYAAPSPAEIEHHFGLPVDGTPYSPTIAPLKPGPVVLADRVVVAQWGMIPPGSNTRTPTTRDGRRMSTNNARRETVATAWTYRQAWARGQRCLIPAWSYDEPYWGTGKNIWWRFGRADGQPWALAGLCSEWTDPATSEVVTSYTMLTQNCDSHPLLRLMHKPDPKLPADQQDKRAVVPIKREDWRTWLNGSTASAESLVQLPAMGLIRHGSADPTQLVVLPGIT